MIWRKFDFKAWFKVLASLLLLSSLLKSSGCLKQCTFVRTDDDRGNISKQFSCAFEIPAEAPPPQNEEEQPEEEKPGVEEATLPNYWIEDSTLFIDVTTYPLQMVLNTAYAFGVYDIEVQYDKETI